jgi:hypothetical protein
MHPVGSLPGRLRRRPLLAAASVYAVLALALFGQGLVPGRIPASSDYLWQSAPWSASTPPGVSSLGSNFELSDSITQFHPFLLHARRALPGVPLWNPYLMGGRPFLANSQAAVFSPFSLPAYVLPFWHSLALIQMLKVFVAAMGAFVFGRSLGMRFAGALAAGAIFGFSQALVDWASWPHTSSWALLPWLLVLVERLVRRPGTPIAAGLAVLVALVWFGGHPESSVDVIAAAVAWFAFRLLQRGVRRRAALLAFGSALLAGTCLAAISLIPFTELLLSSWDYDSRRGSFGAEALDTQYLRAFFMPDWWGRPTQGIIAPFATIPVYGHAYYAGALSLILAAGALVGRPRPERIALVAAGLLGLLALAGVEPIFSVVAELRGPGKMDKLFFYVVFCIAMLAGFGLDDLGEPLATRVRPLLVAGLIVLAVPAIWALADGAFSLSLLGAAFAAGAGLGAADPAHLADAAEAAEIRMGALLGWLALAGAGFGLVWWRSRGRLGPSAFAAGAISLIVLDLLKVGMGYNPTIPATQALQPSTGALRYLESRRPARFAGLDGSNLLGLPALAPNLAMRYGLYDARGYDFPAERRFARLWSDNVSPVLPEPRFSFPDPTPRALRALGLLSVRSIIQDVREEPLSGPGLRLAYQGDDARIYANEYALPRAFVVGAQRVVAGEAAARSAIRAGLEARDVVLTEHPITDLPRGPAGGSAGTAALSSYAPERVSVSVTARRPAMLVLTDTYFPGWRAEVDGAPARVHRVDYMLRGVSVPPGSHRVEFAYRPTSWRAGWIVSLVAALVLLAAVAYARRR